MADFRVPPPHTPVPPNSHKIESSTLYQKTVRLEEFEITRINIEQFIIMSTNDPQSHDNLFMQIANLKELISSGILNAEQENILINELNKLYFDLNSGNLKIKNIYDRILSFNINFEEKSPKVKVFNVMQSLKNNLCLSPLDDLNPMDIEEFKNMEKTIFSFIKEDIENFRINKLFNEVKTLHETFLHHPRRNYIDTINRLKHIADDVRSGLI